MFHVYLLKRKVWKTTCF